MCSDDDVDVADADVDAAIVDDADVDADADVDDADADYADVNADDVDFNTLRTCCLAREAPLLPCGTSLEHADRRAALAHRFRATQKVHKKSC